MTPAEARLVLAAWRAGSADPGDPDVAQALDLARRDPELGRWWEAQAAFHGEVAQALRSASPPADLADRILAARKTRHPRFSQPPGPAARTARSIPWWTAIAASLALLAGLWFAFRPRGESEPGFDVFRGRMVRAVLREYRMDVVTNDLPAIRGFLAGHRAPSDFELPPTLAATPALGAGLLSWQGQPVSMVCLNGGDLGTLFLFVASADTLPHAPLETLEFAQINQLATASWSRAGRTFVLAAVTTPDQLRQFLNTPRPDRAAVLRPPHATPSSSASQPPTEGELRSVAAAQDEPEPGTLTVHPIGGSRIGPCKIGCAPTPALSRRTGEGGPAPAGPGEGPSLIS
jgi:hypothetical protein